MGNKYGMLLINSSLISRPFGSNRRGIWYGSHEKRYPCSMHLLPSDNKDGVFSSTYASINSVIPSTLSLARPLVEVFPFAVRNNNSWYAETNFLSSTDRSCIPIRSMPQPESSMSRRTRFWTFAAAAITSEADLLDRVSSKTQASPPISAWSELSSTTCSCHNTAFM